MNERGTERRERRKRNGLIPVLLCAAIGIGAGAFAQVDEDQPYATSWILVRLETPLEPAGQDGRFSLLTGKPALDALIAETNVQGIEHALAVSTLTPRNPEALVRNGLDRTYKFHVPVGSDIGGLVERFSRLPQVVYAEPDYIMTVASATFPDDPLFPQQWYFDQESDADMDAPQGWAVAMGAGVKIAVVDTGVDSDHEDLVDNLEPGYNLVTPSAYPEDDYNPPYGHGAPVASLVAAVTNNGTGMAGTCWDCGIVPVKVFDSDGNGPISRVTDGVVWATDHGARVINLSAGWDGVNDDLATLLSGIQYAYDAGVVFVAPTGNSDLSRIAYPARYVETIAAGATDQPDDRAAPFTCAGSSPDGGSNCGPRIDVVAPGDRVLAASTGGGYATRCGTSFSSPLVAGLAGIVETIDPSAGREEMRHLIRSGAEDQVGTDPAEDPPGFDVFKGWGRVNVERTLLAAESSSSLQVDGKLATRVFYDAVNPLADSYDFVRGDLGALSETWAGVDLGDVVCLENDSPDPDTLGNEDLGIPEPGQGYFYLARFNGAPGAGSYGGSSSNRDRVVPSSVHSLAWTAESDQAYSYFGISVHGAGDVNADGYDDVIVGAYWYDNGQENEGAAFVYLGSPEGLESVPVWEAEGDQTGAWFGWSVAGAGDVNGDGYDDVIVGAQHHGNGQVEEGRAYLYPGNSTGVGSTPIWTAESDQAEAHFGWRVRSAGNVNGDAYDDVIVVAFDYDNGQTNEGKVFVYTGSESGPSASPAWSFETDQAEADLTGAGTAGDVNNDGYDDVIVGANEYDGPETNEGRAWVFMGSGFGLLHSPSTTLQIDMAEAYFGLSTYAAGDVNGDGFDDVVVSAAGYTNGVETAEGAAFVYLGSAGGVATSPAWSFESDQADAFLGWSAETAGDVNGDGYDDIIVGTDRYDLTRTDQGGAWVFLGSSSGLSTVHWTDSGTQPDARYGFSAAAAGDVNGDGLDDVIVGARRFDNGETNEGRALVYHGPLPATTTSDCSVEGP